MKTQLLSAAAVFTLVLVLLSPGYASEFTWQGNLDDGGQVLDGQYDLLLKLFDVPEGGNQFGIDIVLPELTIFDGKFYDTLDFGIDVFDGQTRWLEVAYKPTGFAGQYRVLWAPRSPVTRTHYEVMAEVGEFHKSLAALCPVGIGTMNPTNILTVVSPGGGEGIALVNNAGSTRGLMSIAGGDWGFLELYSPSGRGVYINPLSSYFQGNVGIGTMNPTNTLTVVSPGGGEGIALVNNAGNTRGLMSITNGDWGFLDLYGPSGRGVYINPLSSYFQGNVGIGTTNPESKLSVGGDGHYAAVIHGEHSSGNWGRLGGRYFGVYGMDVTDGSLGSAGVLGKSTNNKGVWGQSENGRGVSGSGITGVDGRSSADGGYGVYGGKYVTDSGYGVYGRHDQSGNCGYLGGNTCGVYGISSADHAGYFSGKVTITGNLSKGSGSFKIDHPLEPENKYLHHSFVESPDMMNVYNGNITLDEKGQAVVQLPDYFEALNRDFRYQLTPIGAPGPNLYIAEKISDNRFKIAGGTSSMEVSWQVTGVRQDPFAVTNRIQVEEDKLDEERGYYLHPKAYGLPEEKGVEIIRNPRPSQTKEVAKKQRSNESDKHYN